MSLTSRDETDLLLPLYRGVHEEPRFATFLDRLKRRTNAEYVALAIRRKGSPVSEAVVYFAGIDLHHMAREAGLEDLYTLEGVHHSRLRPYRVYSVAEFVDHDPEYKARRERNIGKLGIVDERVVRVSEDAGLEAWLILARDKACTAADSALLSTLAPYVATALHGLNALEQQRVLASLSAMGLDRSGAGWIMFDKEARVLAIEPGTERRLGKLGRSPPRIGERLRNLAVETDRVLVDAARRLAGSSVGPSDAIVLSEEPRVDALLVPAANDPGFAGHIPVPAMIAYCRFAESGGPERAGRLAQLFGLPPREAELAIALADGMTIAEAAGEMGLTLETARNYSKRLYAKLAVRGQVDLVRMIYQSSAALA